MKRRHSRGRPTEASTKNNVTKVKPFLDINRRWTFEVIANNIVISHCSVYYKHGASSRTMGAALCDRQVKTNGAHYNIVAKKLSERRKKMMVKTF